MTNTGFHHIGLKYKELDRSLEFYKALGLTEVARWGDTGAEIVMLALKDGGIIELLPEFGETFAENGRWIHFAIKVDDVEAAYKTALSAGALPITEPKVVPLDSKPQRMSINIAFVKGPNGEELEFFKVV